MPDDVHVSASTAINVVIGVAGAAFALAVLAYAAEKINATSYFTSINSFWGIFVTLILIGASLLVILPAIKKLMETFTAGKA